MTEKDIQPVNMTPEAIPAAMASAALPIGVTYEPSVSQIIALEGAKKFHVVYSSKDAPGLITDVMVFKAEYIKANPDVIKALIQGYLDGLDYMKKNPDKAAEIIGKFMGVTGAEVKEQLSGVYNPTLGEMAKVFARSKDTLSLYGSGAIISQVLKANQGTRFIQITSNDGWDMHTNLGTVTGGNNTANARTHSSRRARRMSASLTVTTSWTNRVAMLKQWKV
jgi:NitT/TauT family transport system substrate-binding protein